VVLDQSTVAKSSANFLDGQKKHATHLSGPPNYQNTNDVTVGHVTTGNGQYFLLDAEAVNREAMMSSQHHSMLQWQPKTVELTVYNAARLFSFKVFDSNEFDVNDVNVTRNLTELAVS